MELLSIYSSNTSVSGWAMQAGGFIFLKRKWELDQKILVDCVDYYSDLKHETQVSDCINIAHLFLSSTYSQDL